MMNRKTAMAAMITAVFLMGAVACIELPYRLGPKLQIATTTSLYDTGLLDSVANYYKQHYGVSLFFIPVGTGQAVQHAKMGETDLLLAHAPSVENTFMQVDGLGVVRKVIAYNFFAIVGPADDPAEIENLNPTEALSRIADAGRAGNAKWVSRGDLSGTHIKEVNLWVEAGFSTSHLRKEPWYREAGTGMGATLNMANEMRAYTLADMGTYLRYYTGGLIDLKVLVSRGAELLNVYSVMAVNPSAYPELNFGNALNFIKFLVSDEGQNLIGGYGIDEYGQPLFYPAVRLLRENTDPTVAGWIRDYAFLSYGNQKWECPPPYRLGRDDLYG